jgi:hypothetical protein
LSSPSTTLKSVCTRAGAFSSPSVSFIFSRVKGFYPCATRRLGHKT